MQANDPQEEALVEIQPKGPQEARVEIKKRADQGARAIRVKDARGANPRASARAQLTKKGRRKVSPSKAMRKANSKFEFGLYAVAKNHKICGGMTMR
mmetsp:Transcript_21006/g.45677  ORF Transcript_21006/g.45677 Transcript_21006/m.45677 type:complete len:97 (+) Transcript_21006:466-756(+)